MDRKSHYHFIVLVIVLMLSGAAAIYYQHVRLGLPLVPNASKTVWEVESRLTFDALKDTPIKATLMIPQKEAGFVSLQENYISKNYGVTEIPGKVNRKVQWARHKASGKQALYYRLTLYKHAEQQLTEKWDFTSSAYVGSIHLEGATKVAASALLEDVVELSADKTSMTSALIKALNDRNSDNVQLLLGNRYSAENIADAAVALLSLNHVPARVIHGIRLKTATKAQPIAWVAMYTGTVWQYFDPKTAEKTLPDDILIWYEGEDPAFKLEGGEHAKLSFTVKSSIVNAVELAQYAGQDRSAFISFSLLSLPLETQHVYSILATVPLGVLMILLLRSFVGVSTFGTFMPVLIALAFRETHVAWGIGLFLIITFFGLAIRHYLDELHLLIVPRLGVILTTVVMMMGFISIMSAKLGFAQGLSIALFPMVILTMTIERISILWEERGGYEAMTTTLGSFFTAICAYLAMTNVYATYIFFVFPGAYLMIMALMLLIGRYRGYRLSELIRFRAMAKKVK